MILLFSPVSSLALWCRLITSVYDRQKCPLCIHTCTRSSIIYSPSYVTFFKCLGVKFCPPSIFLRLLEIIFRDNDHVTSFLNRPLFFEILPYPRMNVHNMNMHATKKIAQGYTASIQATDRVRFQCGRRKYASKVQWTLKFCSAPDNLLPFR